MALPLMSYAGTCGSLAEGEGLKAEGEAKLSTRFCPENGFHDTSERRVLVGQLLPLGNSDGKSGS